MKSFPIMLAAATIALGSTTALAQQAGPPRPAGVSPAMPTVVGPAAPASATSEPGSTAPQVSDTAPVAPSTVTDPAFPLVDPADALSPTTGKDSAPVASAPVKKKKSR